MTKNEVIQTIKDEIRMNGFQPEMDERFSQMPFLKGESDLYIAVRIRERLDFANCDFEKKIAAYTVDVEASVRKMGGNPTPEELLDAANQIRRGAELARNLQGMNLAYTEEA